MSLYSVKTRIVKQSDSVRLRRSFEELNRLRYSFAEAIRLGRKSRVLEGTSTLQSLRNSVRRAKEIAREELQKDYSVRVVTRHERGERIQLTLQSDDSLASALASIKERVRDVRRERRRGWGFCLPDFVNDYHGRHNGVPNRVINKMYKKKLSTHKAPKETDKSEYVGIEIECIAPRGADISKLYPYHQWVNLGSDGSIETNGGEDGIEVRVCVKREEVREVVPKITEALRSIGARVNRSCGLHVHLDQRNAQNVVLNYQKLVRAQGLLYTIVPSSRRSNQYCRRTRQYNFDTARHGNRYHAINACAYGRYRTLEVRLFGGTLDGSKIVNWIETLYGITDGSPSLRCPKNFDIAKRYWKLSDENLAWLKERAAQFAQLNSAPVAESENGEPAPVIVPVTNTEERPRTATAERLRRNVYGIGTARLARAAAQSNVLNAESVRRAVDQLRSAQIEPIPQPSYEVCPDTGDTGIYPSDDGNSIIISSAPQADSIFHQAYIDLAERTEAENDTHIQNTLFQGVIGRFENVTFTESNPNQEGENHV